MPASVSDFALAALTAFREWTKMKMGFTWKHRADTCSCSGELAPLRAGGEADTSPASGLQSPLMEQLSEPRHVASQAEWS